MDGKKNDRNDGKKNDLGEYQKDDLGECPQNNLGECPNKEYNCPVGVTLELIGGKYKALILWHLIGRTLRFGELRRLVPQATPKMMTQQLRELEEANLVIRTVYPVVPPKVEYSLSQLGVSIRGILESMYDWGADYLENSGKEINCSMCKHE